MKNYLIIGAALLYSTAAMADSITILNSGSKTGGFSMQSTAYSQDLAKDFDITLVNPGDRCVALGNLLPKITGPVLMPWASDYEAVGRDGACVTFDINQGTVVRYDTSPVYVCTRGGDVTKDSGKVGHTVPANGPLARVITELNKEFKTSHSPVVYDGSGDARLAIINGEVDYALLSKKHTGIVMEADSSINCDTSLAVDGLAASTGNKKLAFGFDTVWLVLNADANTTNKIKMSMMEKHLNCNSAIGTWSKCNTTLNSRWDLTVEEASKNWETMVATQR
jgi:hypothetical protein